MAEDTQIAPEQEISDGAGRIVAGRFYTLRDADAVMTRLRGLELVPQLQERTEMPSGQPRLWIWVFADDLERARECMRPGDVLGMQRNGAQPAADEAGGKGFLGRLRR